MLDYICSRFWVDSFVSGSEQVWPELRGLRPLKPLKMPKMDAKNVSESLLCAFFLYCYIAYSRKQDGLWIWCCSKGEGFHASREVN